MSEPTIDEQIAQVQAALGIGRPAQVYILRMENTALFNPKSPEFKSLLLAHYKYGLELQEKNQFLLAGPATGPGPAPGSGLFVIKAENLEEATKIAENEPFHVAGLRVNTVIVWTITAGSIIAPFREVAPAAAPSH
eukprot:c23004_g1_i1.p1 GENE.c23004_g1_i1~~c23004_g1_i1.p1  ORF type:complete len:150 (+),score=45.77 c23004_g1_i1:45-452(+)